jgi:hypothetical protein
MNRALDRRTRKFLFQMLFGAVVGAGSTLLFLTFFRDVVDQSSGPQLATVCVGSVYAIIGIFVTIGSAAPRLGASVLNVEDAEELTELRSVILPSGLACIAIGSFLLALALAPAAQANEASRTVALSIATLSLVASILFGVMASRRMDELSRLLGTESATVALYVLSTLFGGWAAVAHLGFVQWVDPLTFVAATAAIQLLSAFIVVGKRGMLMPR